MQLGANTQQKLHIKQGKRERKEKARREKRMCVEGREQGGKRENECTLIQRRGKVTLPILLSGSQKSLN